VHQHAHVPAKKRRTAELKKLLAEAMVDNAVLKTMRHPNADGDSASNCDQRQ